MNTLRQYWWAIALVVAVVAVVVYDKWKKRGQGDGPQVDRDAIFYPEDAVVARQPESPPFYNEDTVVVEPGPGRTTKPLLDRLIKYNQ